MDVWKLLIKKHLHRSTGQSCLIALDILCVDVGIKPAFLFDYYGDVNLDMMCSFLQALHNEGLVRHILNVLRVADTYFIFNPDMVPGIVCSLQKPLAQIDTVFVDIGRADNNDGPTLVPMLESERSHFTEHALPHLLNIIESLELSSATIIGIDADLKSQCKDCNVSRCKDCNLGWCKDCNLSTLSGLLLGYPVIYYYKTLDENCLSFEPLCVYELTGTYSEIVSYVKPEHRYDSSASECSKTALQPESSFDATKCGDGSNESSAASVCHLTRIVTKKKSVPEKNKVIYSFSVPVVLLNEALSVRINAWFSELKRRTEWRTLFHEIELKSRTVILPSVAI